MAAVPAHAGSSTQRRRSNRQPVAPPARSAALPPDPATSSSSAASPWSTRAATSASTTRRSTSAAASSSSSSAPPARASRPSCACCIKEREPTSGAIRVAGRDLAEITRRKVPYYRRNIGVVFQDFKLLRTGRSTRTSPTRCRRPAASRREIRNKVPDILRLTGLSTEAPQLPRPALRRRAAARVGRARVRQPPAAPAGRRADRQPRPDDVDRDHAAAVPDQPHRDDRRRGDPRLAHGRPDAPPRHRAQRGHASSATRPPACTRQDEQTTDEFGQLLTRAELDRLDP